MYEKLCFCLLYSLLHSCDHNNVITTNRKEKTDPRSIYCVVAVSTSPLVDDRSTGERKTESNHGGGPKHPRLASSRPFETSVTLLNLTLLYFSSTHSTLFRACDPIACAANYQNVFHLFHQSLH